MKIKHYQEPTFEGFGDILNLISFENYLIDEQTDILYHYDETRTSFVNYIVNDFFSIYFLFCLPVINFST